MNQLYNCDFRNSDIHDNSIDLIMTDPPYLKEYVSIYGDLGKWAASKLKDGGSLVCYIGHYNLPSYIELLGQHLTYWWIFAVKLKMKSFPMNYKKIVPSFKPMLWYVKGNYNGKYVYDHITSDFEGKEFHKWQQSTIEARHVIERLTEPGAVICDPFAGSGTTGIACMQLEDRNFIGIEENAEHYTTMEKRLQNAEMQTKLSSFCSV